MSKSWLIVDGRRFYCPDLERPSVNAGRLLQKTLLLAAKKEQFLQMNCLIYYCVRMKEQIIRMNEKIYEKN